MAEATGGGAAGAGTGAGAGAGDGGAGTGAQAGTEGTGAAAGGGTAAGSGTAAGTGAGAVAGAGTGQAAAGSSATGAGDVTEILRRDAEAQRKAATDATAQAETERKAREAAETELRGVRLEKAITGYNGGKDAIKVDATLATTLLQSSASGITVEFDDKGQIKDIAKVMKDLIAKFPNVVGQGDTRGAGGQRSALTVNEQIDAMFTSSGGNKKGNGFRL